MTGKREWAALAGSVDPMQDNSARWWTSAGVDLVSAGVDLAGRLSANIRRCPSRPGVDVPPVLAGVQGPGWTSGGSTPCRATRPQRWAPAGRTCTAWGALAGVDPSGLGLRCMGCSSSPASTPSGQAGKLHGAGAPGLRVVDLHGMPGGSTWPRPSAGADPRGMGCSSSGRPGSMQRGVDLGPVLAGADPRGMGCSSSAGPDLRCMGAGLAGLAHRARC